MNALIAKPIIKNQYWVVTDGVEKVGNVIADGSGFEVKLNGYSSHYKDTKAIQKQTKITFETIKKVDRTQLSLPFKAYPTPKHTFNSMFDVKRKLHLFTTSQKSKCYYAAGWFTLDQGNGFQSIFCPKYIFIQRYPYSGPYKTQDEAEKQLNIS